MSTSKSLAAVGAASLIGLAAWSPSAQAVAKIEINDDKNFGVGFLLQPHFRMDLEGSNEGTPSYDPFIRRARILFTAQLTDKVLFFAETDNPNFGRNGDWSSNTFIQDAWVEYNVSDALQIDAGMLLIPFSHHFYQAATSLLGLDYHSGLASYASGSHKVWRDAGIMARGTFMDQHLEYRVALTNGVESGFDVDGDGTANDVNPMDMPRMSGRLVYSVFDSEAGPGVGGFYCDGIYFKEDGGDLVSTKQVLAIGASFDWQQEAIAAGQDHLGLAGDVFWDLPMGAPTSSLNGQLDFYYYDDGEGASSTGMGLLTEVGYRYQRLQPVLALEYFDVAGDADEQAGDYIAPLAGFNWWYKGHNANLKFLFGTSKTADGDTSTTESFSGHYAVVQTQFLL